MAKKNKPTKQQPKPVPQPKKDIKSKDSAYHPTEGAYSEHPVTKADREEADEMQREMEAVLHQADIDKEKGRSISMPRWEEAQKAERAAHDADPRNTAQHYAEVYKKYFKYVGLGTDLQGLHVMEVGPADHPALALCANWGLAMIVEPLPSGQLFETARMLNIGVLDAPLETYSGLINWRSAAKEHSDKPVEIWLFNVMQHVINPDKFVEVCKGLADRIRFFEPINTPVEPHHPHSYTYQDYINYFGGCCQMYKGGSEQNFHTADCMYGVWVRQ